MMYNEVERRRDPDEKEDHYHFKDNLEAEEEESENCWPIDWTFRFMIRS